MNLVQQDIVYKYMTSELLESMINLSMINIDRFQSISGDRVGQLRSSMTSFDTGRQTGKSTAIAHYAKENENVIVVSTSSAAKKIMAEQLQSVSNFNLCVKDFDISNTSNISDTSNIFRGLRGEFDLIFDECNLEDIRICLWYLGKYSGIKIRSIVKVGL